MVRPPCCDKVGIKKGPWTPEEDIVLVSYIQKHGPGNWRSIPTNTGLLRCSKSCRLRWTNYLRPGIKRGNFTPHEEGMIVHLQSLLGNKWASIASYLPQRTDNDIKNYWNTHLKKKLRKNQTGNLDANLHASSSSSTDNPTNFNQFLSPGTSNLQQQTIVAGSTSSMYASSAENISRLLEGWMMRSSSQNSCPHSSLLQDSSKAGNIKVNDNIINDDQCLEGEEGVIFKDELFESVLSFDDNLNSKNESIQDMEKWFLDESAGQVKEAMGLSSIF